MHVPATTATGSPCRTGAWEGASDGRADRVEVGAPLVQAETRNEAMQVNANAARPWLT